MTEHKTPYKPETLENYKEATWDFILEHCDILESGAMFVKFHLKGREDLEKRIRARWLYNYHREDVRAKEAHQQENRGQFEAKKRLKAEKWKASKEERMRAFEAVKRQNEANMPLHHKVLKLIGIKK